MKTLKNSLICICLGLLTYSCQSQMSEEQCAKNSLKTVLVLELESDQYHCDYDVENQLKIVCYNIVDKHKPLYQKFNLEQAIKYAETHLIDMVVYGFITVNYYDDDYTPSVKPALNATAQGVEEGAKKWGKKMSGSWACATLYGYKVKEKQTIELMRDQRVKKVGG